MDIAMISYLIKKFNVIIVYLTSSLEMVTWHYLASYGFITLGVTVGHNPLIFSCMLQLVILIP